MADSHKCAHETCRCQVTGTNEYCSDHCRQAAADEKPCTCGHQGCMHA